MNEEDRQFVLDNVDNINADVHDIDELCCALEHSTIFAVDYIQTFATRLIDLDYKYKNLQSKIDKANEILEEILVVSDWEHKGRFRPVKGTTAQDVYKTIVKLNELLETPRRINYDILKEDK